MCASGLPYLYCWADVKSYGYKVFKCSERIETTSNIQNSNLSFKGATTETIIKNKIAKLVMPNHLYQLS